MFDVRLAPMCGITDHLYRTICYEMGCDLAYTEMISAMGYLCAPGQRATRELMVRGEKEPRLIIQLFGKDPEIVSRAAAIMSDSGIYDGIDLNMGCPAKKIAPSGEGCGLMRTPDVAKKMMHETVRNVSHPVSVKIRLGYDSEHINIFDFAKMAEDEGISSLTVHGRTREQQYSGDADWDMIARVKQLVSIPVIGNGDLFTAEEAVKRQRESGADGVMIGRGALGNPWIFREIKELMCGGVPSPVSLSEKKQMILRHYTMMLQNKPEPVAVREMRKHIGWYIKGMKNAARFRAEINQCDKPASVFLLMEQFFAEQECT